MDEGRRATAIAIEAPARLHLGFLDLEGSLGRRFGSVGLALAGIATRLTIASSASLEIVGPGAARAERALAQAAAALGVPPLARIVIESAIPEHVGLGSGTQLGLAVAAGLARLHGRDLAAPALAATVERGARSGIGIGAFAQGGLLVDGGRAAGGEAAPIVARAEFPEDWPLLLILDEARRGLHGAAEIAAFGALPPFPPSLAGELCRLVLMGLLPGVAERCFAAVADAIATMQARLGDYFAPAQGGGRFASPEIAEAVETLRRDGVVAVGQSSWGPTGFALFETMAGARAASRLLSRAYGELLALRIVTARNRGAAIGRIEDAIGRQRGSA